MEIFTIEQYASIRGISVQAVYNQIYAKRELKGVTYQKHGKGYLLTGSKKEILK